MDQFFTLCSKGAAWLQFGKSRGFFRFVCSFPDLLIVSLVLEATELWSYFFARIASLLVPTSLTLLGTKLTPRLVVLIPDRVLFQTAAARINLGYLMVCGSVSLFVLILAPYLRTLFGVAGVAFDETLMWLVIGQSAPVWFGATHLFMRVMQRRSFYDLLSCMTATLFFIGLALTDHRDGTLVAQTFAAAQLTKGAICALLLSQQGVWPGITALLHKEIKLF